MDLKRLFMLIGVLVLAFGLVACGGAAEEEDPFAEPDISEPLEEEDPLVQEEPLGEEGIVEEEPLEEEEIVEEDPLAEDEIVEEPLGEEEIVEEDPLGEDVAEEEGLEEELAEDEGVVEETAAMAPVILSNELIGMDIVAGFADDVDAEVEEVLIDQQGMIHFVIFDADDFLGLGEDQMVALDWDLFQVKNQGAMTDATTPATPVIVFMGTEDDLAAAHQVDIAVLDEADLVVDAATLSLAPEFDGLIQVSEFADWDLVQDWELVNAEGEDLGVPDQLVLNLPQGEAMYLIADVGVFLGIEENEIAIPWRLVQVDLVEEAFIVPVDQTAIESAPVFNQAMFEDDTMLAEDWDSEIATYWEGIEPIEAAELDE